MDIRPVPAPERNLCGIDFFLLWAGVAISLAEIWAGGFLAPLGFWSGLWAILAAGSAAGRIGRFRDPNVGSQPQPEARRSPCPK